jgi:ABC-type transporter Mla maintaining outer membrane lipid asymmetry ATPase subunit MlaF
VTPTARLPAGLVFAAGAVRWRVKALSFEPGSWTALVPDGPEAVVDPSARLSRILATLEPPEGGTVELLGHPVAQLGYRALQRLRARLGFVHRSGGLLSNRTVRGNLAVPLWVHGGLEAEQVQAAVHAALKRFHLVEVADHRPHRLDAATAWRARLARALILAPRWLVLEGGRGWRPHSLGAEAWSEVARLVAEGAVAAAICLRHGHQEFEGWFASHGGRVVRYPPGRIDGS